MTAENNERIELEEKKAKNGINFSKEWNGME